MGSEMVWLLVLAGIAGVLGGIHVPINGALSTRIESTFVATFTFYGVAFVLIGLLNVLTFDRESFKALAEVPIWYYIVPGVISVIVVGANTFLIPRLGAANVFVVTVSAQLVVRTTISHFGWLDTPTNPVSLTRLAGGLLLLVGAIMVVRG